VSTINVTNQDGAAQPFLRGILTRSLQKAGLSFSEAYQIACEVRDTFDQDENISTKQILDKTSTLLSAQFGPNATHSYITGQRDAAWILVRDTTGYEEWFSRNLHQRRLEICGLHMEEAERLTHKIHDGLLELRQTRIDRDVLRDYTVNVLREEAGDKFADNYTAWHYFLKSGQPLIIMIGGTAGVGKSTLSAEIATRFNITRYQSTDMLREVMRTMVAVQLMPELHESSFNAWKALPTHQEYSPSSKRVIDGYHRQADLVEVAAEAVLQRALRENVSLLLEGVHVRPSLIDKIPHDSNAIVIQIILGVTNKKQLQRQFQGRSKSSQDRRADRYLESFDAIWELQKALLAEAKTSNLSVIINDNLTDALAMIMRNISNSLRDHNLKTEQS
jgi:2-phosphoglycerate kinase